MFDQIKNVIVDKETTYKPKRTRPTISSFSILYDIGILMTFQPNINLYHSPYRTDLSCLDIMRNPWVVCGHSSPIFYVKKWVRNLSWCQKRKSACRLLNNLLILIFCFIASITVTTSSEVPLPGKGHHHILSLEELSP